ncbi:M57 family metalloprotease [Corallococcus terminator]
MSLQASREMLERDDNSQEHYHTTNLVSSTIQTIFIHPTSSIPTAIYIGIQDAIANYNALALGLEFSYTPNPCQETPGCPPRPPYAIIELAINPVLPTGPSATSGFPSGGKPFPSISLGSGLAAYPRDTIEHVITHEIGHTIGYRHSDYFNRAISCGGSATNEGSAGVGAIHITGTPTGASAGGSLMNSCFPTGATGEFTASDVTALEALY